MRRLLQTALLARRHRFLVCISIVSMILLTFASQLEIVTLGIITHKGPDFFELFAPIQEGKLQKTGRVDSTQFLTRWKEIDLEQKGVIEQGDTSRFLEKYRGNDLIAQVIGEVNKWIPLSTNMIAFAFFIVFVALFKAGAIFCQRYFSKMIAIRVSRDLRQSYFEHLQILPMKFYHQYSMGNLSSRAVGDAALVAEALNASLVNYLQTPFTVISTFILCLFTSWQLTIILFFCLPIILFPIVFIAKGVKRISKRIQRNQEVFTSVLIDFLAGIQTIKVFGMENFSLKKYCEQNNAMASLEEKSARYDLSSRPIIHTIGMFFLATALLYGIYTLQMNLSDVFVYCGLLYVFYEPIKKFAEENAKIQRGIAAAERMQEVLEIEPYIQDDPQSIPLQRFNKTIAFDHVWFRYEEEWVLKGVSFTVNKGEKIAIVGPTGSGKSTIVQLLPRLYDIQKGAIRIDGLPLTAYTQESLRENISFVPQKPFLFLDTVAANISFGRPYSEEQIIDAARRAHADEFIRELPQGYQTLLLEMGKNLSGGQQQRLAIARALIKNAPILILDEATSSLDNLSENLIKKALNEIRHEVTQIIIAHRLSTIEDADKIIVIDKGEIVAQGTKDALLETCPLFRRLWSTIASSSVENSL